MLGLRNDCKIFIANDKSYINIGMYSVPIHRHMAFLLSLMDGTRDQEAAVDMAVTLGLVSENNKSILDCLINLKVNEFYYNYQKQKVIYEIAHLNKAPILEFIETFESKILPTVGYRKSTFGLREDVENIDFTKTKKYLEEKLSQGLTISLVGGFDIKSIAQYLDTLLPIRCKSIL